MCDHQDTWIGLLLSLSPDPELKDTIFDNEQIEIDLMMALWARCC